MRTLLRRATIVLFILGLLATLAWQLPVTHQRLLERVVAEAAVRGFELKATSPRFHLIPLGCELSEVHVRQGDRSLFTAERLELALSLAGIKDKPPIIDSLRIEGAHLDPAQWVGIDSGDSEPAEGWPIEIRRLEIVGYQIAGIDLELYELHLGKIDASGGLGAEHGLSLRSPTTTLVRDGRQLELGELSLVLRSLADGLEIVSLRTEQLNGTGSLRLHPFEMRSSTQFGLDREMLDWYQPGLAEQLELDGRLELSSELFFATERFELAISSPESSLEVLGRRIDGLEVQVDRQRVDFSATGRWGRLDGVADPTIGLAATLELSSSIDELQPWLDTDQLVALPAKPLTLQARLDLSSPWPIEPETLRISGALQLEHELGQADAQMVWLSDALEVRDLAWRQPGLEIDGDIDLDEGQLEARFELLATRDAAADWIESLGGELPSELGGGPLLAQVSLDGPSTDPKVSGQLSWHRLELADKELGTAYARFVGDLDELDLTFDIDLPITHLASTGTLWPGRRELSADWRFDEVESRDLELLEGWLCGPLGGSGELEYSEDALRLDGRVQGRLASSSMVFDDAVLEFDLDDAGFRAELAIAEASGGSALKIRIETGLDPSSPVTGSLQLQDFPARELEGSLEDARIDLQAELAGLLDAPVLNGSAQLVELPSQFGLDGIELEFEIADGELIAISTEDAADLGALEAGLSWGLAALPRPDWLWPELEDDRAFGALRCGDCDLLSFASARLPADPRLRPKSTRFDLDLRTRGEAEVELILAIHGVELLGQEQSLQAADSLRLRFKDDLLQLDPLRLSSGESTWLDLHGELDLETRTVRAQLGGRFGQALLEPVLGDLELDGKLDTTLTLQGPIDRLDRLQIELDLTLEGSLELAEPPLQLEAAQLHVSGSERDGLEVEGSTTINRGQATISGSWNRQLGTGIIIDVESAAALLPLGIFSRWSGTLVLEPQLEDRAILIGNVILEEGLWDEDLELATTMLSSFAAEAGAEIQPLAEALDLDLEIRAARPIQVANNLGEFELRWRRLEIDGTAAEPRLDGTIQILPGGRLRLGSGSAEIRRGSISFAGSTEPEVEILTADPVSLGGSQSTGHFDLSELARQQMINSIGSLIGLSSDAIEPIDIGAETESDPGTRFTLARQVGRHLAVFLTSDLTDPSKRTTVLQGWDWSSLPGLAVQIIDEADDQDGWALIERLELGGRASDDDRAKLSRIEFEGDWPLSKFSLRRALRIEKGDRWDPFLALVAERRAKRRLAEAGYQRARVSTLVDGAEDRPVLHISCEPGLRRVPVFSGASLPRSVRRRVTALLRSGLLAERSHQAIRRAGQRALSARGFPDSQLTVRDEGDLVTVHVDRGGRLELAALVLDGLPLASRRDIEKRFANPVQLADLWLGRGAARNRLGRALVADGFGSAKLGEPHLVALDDYRARLVFDIVPGPRSRIGELSIIGQDPLGLSSRRDFPLRSGSPLRRKVIDAALRKLRLGYRRAGYPEVHLRTTFSGDDALLRDLTLEIDPGPYLQIEEIEIRGLQHSTEKLIRSGLAIEPGRPLATEELDESLERIAEFSPIRAVSADWTAQGDNGAKVTIDVEERPRWRLGLGLRWREKSGTQILWDLRDRNLLGRGLALELRGYWSDDENAARAWISLPPLPGGRWHIAGYFSNEESLEDGRNEDRRVVSAEIRRPLDDEGGSLLRFYARREDLQLTDAAGVFLADSRSDGLGSQLIIDRRDDPLLPRKGWYQAFDLAFFPRLSNEGTGAIRGTWTWSRAASLPWPRLGWAHGVRLGISEPLDGDLDRSIRFFAGGESTVRGFPEDGLGPRLIDSEGQSLAAGGGAMAVLNAELRYSLREDLALVLFADSGNIWEDSSSIDGELAFSGGLGLRLRTPIGPLRADIAWPLHLDEGLEEDYQIYFGLGQVF